METKLTAFYDQDSKRYHRFLIEPGPITGTIYISKDTTGTPAEITVELKVRSIPTGDNP